MSHASVPKGRGAIMKPSRRQFLRAAVAGVSAAVMLLSRTGLAEQPATMNTVTKAWADRQARIRSARITWVETRAFSKGAISEAFAPILRDLARQQPAINLAGPAPPEDTTFIFECSFSFDGDRVRYAGADPVWSSSQWKFRLNPVKYVFDGSKGRPSTAACPPIIPTGKLPTTIPSKPGFAMLQS